MLAFLLSTSYPLRQLGNFVVGQRFLSAPVGPALFGHGDAFALSLPD